jgi:LCP family protein required for cell wall assembly
MIDPMRKGDRVIQTVPNPAGIPAGDPEQTTKRTRSIRRRRILIAAGGVFVVLLAVLAIQSWKVVNAIVDAEKAVVVPLPTRETEVAFQGLGNVTPISSTTPTPTPTTEPTQAPAQPTTFAGVQVTLTPTTEPTEAPTVAATITPTTEPTDEPDSPSRLDVLRQVVAAGMENGDPGTSSVWDGKKELFILVLGVDRRADGGDQNADVIIIAHLDLVAHKMSSVSIPRDLLVDIPGVGPDKINGSYNDGVLADPDNAVAGVAKVRDTVEQVFGIPIDAYVLIDFDGFKSVVDSVGGIDVDVPEAIHDEDYPTEDYGTEVFDLAAGPQHLDGDTALKYVRTRHDDSDDGRRARQQSVLLALFNKGKSFSSVTKVDDLILAAGDSVQTSFPLEQQLTLVRLAYEMQDADINMASLGQPILQAGETPDGRWAYVGDINEIVSFVHDSLMIQGDATPEPDANTQGEG